MGHLRQLDTVHLHQLCVLPRTRREGSNETSREERDGDRGVTERQRGAPLTVHPLPLRPKKLDIILRMNGHVRENVTGKGVLAAL